MGLFTQLRDLFEIAILLILTQPLEVLEIIAVIVTMYYMMF